MDSFSKNNQISNFIKICPQGAELFHVDRQADMTKLTVAFHNFVNVPKTVKRSVKNTNKNHKYLLKNFQNPIWPHMNIKC
jgi:hypothetical protein